jgi:CheY-like chemotaxis protein
MLAPNTRIDLRRAKVLAVEDNPLALQLLTEALNGLRVRSVKPCASSSEARQLLPTEAFDLIIIDAEMPEENGIDLVRHIRSAPTYPNFTTAVLLVSANTPMDMVTQARDAGANMVVKKPLLPAVLLPRIEWLARNNRQFVSTDSYCGPDRRFKNGPPPPGVTERRADALALTSDTTRALSQDDINSLFD